jgi:hypothetical protein
MPKMTSDEAYQILLTERAYQKLVEEDPNRCYQTELPHSSGEYYCMMMKYVNKFPEIWGNNPDGEYEILEQFRKIGAICLHAIEDHGCPPRIIETDNSAA